MKVYFVSGLGADSRIFNNIVLPNHCTPVFLEWIAPIKKESLKSYAGRLAQDIDATQPFAIVGLSMGGMIATEIAKQYKPVCTVLISSIPASQHLPFYMKAAGALKLHRLVPVSAVKAATRYKRLFTTESEQDKAILRSIIRDSDPHFIYWAMDAILQWRNSALPVPYIHIHGTKDAILPIQYTKPTHVIAKGGHLLVMNRAKEINAILNEIFTNN